MLVKLTEGVYLTNTIFAYNFLLNKYKHKDQLYKTLP